MTDSLDKELYGFLSYYSGKIKNSDNIVEGCSIDEICEKAHVDLKRLIVEEKIKAYKYALSSGKTVEEYINQLQREINHE